MDKIICGVYTGLLASLVSGDVLIQFQESSSNVKSLTSDENLLILALNKNGFDLDKFARANKLFEYYNNLSSNRPEAEIDLGMLEKSMIDLCNTPEQLKALEDSGYLFFHLDDSKYVGLDKVKLYLEMKKQELMNNMGTLKR